MPHMNDDIIPQYAVLKEAVFAQNDNLRQDVRVQDYCVNEFSSLENPASEHPTPQVDRHLCESRLTHMRLHK